MKIRLATRGSALARAQADLVIAALDGMETETVIVSSLGDRNPETAISELSGQGWFSSDVEAAVMDARADAAVHSAKDLPLQLGKGMTIAAYLPRADCRDAVVSRDRVGLRELAHGSRVGTSSARRAAWIQAIRSDLDVADIRGNVDTRLAKLDAGDFDALVLAAAGLDRLGRGDRISERLDPAAFLPAPAQGIVAIETAAAGEVHDAVRGIDDADARAAISAERAVLEGLGGGCLLPLGAWAEVNGNDIVLRAALADGDEITRTEVAGPRDQARELGLRAAAKLSGTAAPRVR